MKKYLITILASFIFAAPSKAGIQEYWQQLKQDIAQTWKSDNYDLYVPLYAWHNRLTYDQEHIDKYNENPWGLGFGKSVQGGNNTWHSLYAMVFKDSNDHPETFIGYAWLKNWDINDNPDLKVGLGYTLGVTQRVEWYFLPVPAPLPIASVSYKDIALQAAYVPGVKNDGNVLFVWTKIPLNHLND
ncbi:MAG: lipid IV(A) palmitoyltransferase PagP [Alphaproteobacteria bacterium]|nr:lipid IV(A) palmitoyltransferase PagP [Alphaproteobacteria bacterium]